MKTKAKTK